MAKIKILQKPNKHWAGKAIILGKIYHYVYSPKYKRKMWIICGDCNNSVTRNTRH